MFHLHNKLQYYLYPGPVDCRKSFYTLSGIVSSIMKRNVLDGEVFIFVNRELTIMKILHMEHGGLVIYHKKLEMGVFRLPSFDGNTTTLPIHWQDMMMMVQDIKMNRRMLKKR
jgi:hypothetical protein